MPTNEFFNTLKATLLQAPEKGLRDARQFWEKSVGNTQVSDQFLMWQQELKMLRPSANLDVLAREIIGLKNESLAIRSLLASELMLPADRVAAISQMIAPLADAEMVRKNIDVELENYRHTRSQAIVLEAISLIDREKNFSEKKIELLEKPDAATVESLNEKLPNEIVFRSSNLGKRYLKSGFNLRGLDLELRLNEITAIVGENAAGKSTILKMIAGELLHSSGQLEYPLFNSKKRGLGWKDIKYRTAFVPQELPEWIGSLEDNIRYAAAIHGILGDENTRETEYIIHRLGLASHMDKNWRELSGGFRLRFALAKALVWKPRLLLLDEPLAFLDVKAQLVVLNDLRVMARSWEFPVSIMLSSQHLHEVEAIADRMIVIKEQSIVFNGPISQLGEGRAVSTFELRSPTTYENLERALRNLPLRHLQNKGIYFSIVTDASVGEHEILQELMANGIEIIYFRDVSQSSKPYFN